ncbi:tyrosyl-DNA phosphodiesterase [Biscogniauxia mediterranea]|nr:tyrosyl-DNA phosphodiesterase [Biscogniauxia mediterranea]
MLDITNIQHAPHTMCLPGQAAHKRVIVPSPFRLTTIRALPVENNHDTVQLIDLLNDPNITECWSFNYMHDIKFLMRHFPRETRTMVRVNIVHGFWHEENAERLALEKQAKNYVNVKLHKAFMPELYGSHNSKMLILKRYDGTAQIIIHTANMIPRDWNNTTNAVWISPRLPKYIYTKDGIPGVGDGGKFGSGTRFKVDLLNYLRAYNARWNVCKALIEDLAENDFSAIRGALVASVPGRHSVDPKSTVLTRWGWPALCKVLESVPAVTTESTEIVIQSPSIPAIGSNDEWLNFLFDKFSCTASSPILLFPFTRHTKVEGQPDPKFKIIFPTADEIRQSLNGYQAGESIYTRTQSIRAQEQLEYLLPLLHHWANDTEKGVLPKPINEKRFSAQAPLIADKDAGRKRAAPHLRTYMRFSGEAGGTLGERPRLDWALLTSASLSRQSWGSYVNRQDRVHITSWEIGVMVWPELFAPTATPTSEADASPPAAEMVATFKTDMPSEAEAEAEEEKRNGNGNRKKLPKAPLVGLRMPYSLPLQKYARSETPWALEVPQTEPDVLGKTWEGIEKAPNGRLYIPNKDGNVYH